MLNVEIHDLAAQEFDHAIEWYELQATGLGTRFKLAVNAQVKKVQLNPSWFLVEELPISPSFPIKSCSVLMTTPSLFGLFHIFIENRGTGKKG